MGPLKDYSDQGTSEHIKLAELEQKLALVMINTEENFVLIDTNLKIVNFNNQFKKQYQLIFGKEVVRGESILDYAQPERIDIVKKLYQRVFSGETVESEINVPLQDKTIAIFQNKFKPAYDVDETIIGAFVSSKNITEKIKTQQLLVANEKRFRNLIENAAEIIALTDKDGKVTYVSPSLERVTGFTPEEMIGQSSFAIMHPDQLEESKHILVELLKNPGVPIPRVNRFLHKKGHYVWVEGTTTNFLNDDNVQAIVANYRDITERKEAEEKSRQSEAKLRAIFDNSAEGLMLLDRNGFIKAFNSKSAENHMLYNVTNDLKVGHKLIDYIHDSRKEYFEGILSRVLKGETIKYDIDYDRTDGKKNWFHASLSPVFEGDTVSGICLTRSDISERKFAEEKLKQSHEILLKLTENVPAAIYQFETDQDGKMSFPFMSKGIEYILPGIKVEQILADAGYAFNMVHPEDLPNLIRSIEESKQNMSNWDLEYRVLLQDNTCRWLKGTSRPEITEGITKVDKVLWHGYIEDITERKNAELQLQELLNFSSDQNKRLQNFAYIVSHNIRSHSSNIIGLVDFIAEAENEEDKLKYFSMLKTSTGRLGETIENLNEIITIQNDTTVRKTKLNLNEEIIKASDGINSLISQTNTTIINNIPKNLIIEAVPSYLESILLNLLTNAVKYRSPHRDPVINISIEEKLNYMVLSIQDNGLGIDLKKNRAKLFGMYKTFHNNKDARGFGLFISKNQIEAMNGKIEVDSELGSGSTFKIYIYHGKN